MPCIEWQGATIRGYGHRRIGGEDWLVHRYVYAQAHGPIPEGMFVMHTCDNPPCINLDHLRLGTHADNMADMVSKGRGRGFAKVTVEQVREIRRRAAAGERQSALSAEFGIHQSQVSRIVDGKRWRRVVV